MGTILAPFQVVGRLLRPGRAAILAGALVGAGQALAQPLQPGEAYVTRFSGSLFGAAGPIIDLNGTVGGIIDVRAPGQPPQGTHWPYEPQRNMVTAGQVGQVFGVAFDDANPPNVYLAATSAFGLHRTPNNAQWMPGMWGQSGGPSTIYRLDAANGYRPRAFSQVTLNGRMNSGPALGNIAYDRFNKQLFATDLETGMIHRIRTSDGANLGYYDHGTQGRQGFFDAETGQQSALGPIGFDPNSRARITNCEGRFDLTPQCWNFALSGRRVWGLGVHRNPARNNEVRLYYSVWSGPAFEDQGWPNAQEDDKRNAVWSVRLGPDGNFAGDVRREFIVPDFFSKPEDIARAGYSQPVSDITFATCGPRPVMLLAERGGIRNLGLTEENSFATPHESRALRYELDQNGTWRAVGRYDVGFYNRTNNGEPFLHANCSGGIAFGMGYDQNTWMADPSKPDQFVWITGDALCSPQGPCNLAGQGSRGSTPQPAGGPGEESPLDESEVHGIQGLAEGLFDEISPATAQQQPSQTNAVTSPGLAQSYLIDTDINFDAQGAIIDEQLARNDATRIGDIAIYAPCEAPTDYTGYFLVPGTEQPPTGYHYRYGSHSAHWSHNRFGSHNPQWSHNRYESHDRWESHWRYASHDRRLSHQRWGSHDRNRSHWRYASHNQRVSHNRLGSHDQRLSHTRTGSHDRRLSHARTGSHNQVLSHNQKGSHNQKQSHNQLGSHNQRLSHAQKGSHNQTQSHNQKGSHSTSLSKNQQHNPTLSHNQKGSHNQTLSHNQKGSHNQTQSHNQKGSHNQTQSHNQKGSHNQTQSHNQKGSHNQTQSHNQKGSHNQTQSHNQKGSHNARQSHSQKGSHSTQASRVVPR